MRQDLISTKKASVTPERRQHPHKRANTNERALHRNSPNFYPWLFPDDKLSLLIDNTQRLARLINGIALEIGLINGSIPSDDVISELLHMGSLKPKDIIGLDAKTINAALTELDTLHSQVKVSDMVTKMQNRLVLLNEVRVDSKSFIQDFFELKDKTVYKDALDTINSSLSNQDQSQLLMTPINALSPVISEFEKMAETMDLNQATDALDSFRYNIKHFEAMQKEVAKSGVFLKELKTLKELKSKSSFFDLIASESKLRESLRPKVLDANTDLSPVIQNFETVFDAWNKLNGSYSSFKTIGSLISSRSNFNNLPFQFTGGLPHGKSDLSTLNSDSANGWIVQRMDNGSVVTASLKKAFTKFDEFIRELVNVETKWNVVEQGTNRESLSSIMSLLQILSRVNSQSAEITTLVADLSQCEAKGFYPSVEPEKMRLLQRNVFDLNHLIDRINDFGDLEHLKNMTEVIDILKESRIQNNDTVKQANDIVKKLKANKKYQIVSVIVKELYAYRYSHADLIAQVAPLANAIVSNYSSLENYHDAVKSKYYENFFQCLEMIEDKGNLIADSINLIQKVQLPDQVFSETKVSVNAILSSQSYLTYFQDIVPNMRRVDFREALVLKSNFPKSLETSRNLNKVSHGFVAIKNLQETRKTWELFSTEVDKLEKDPYWFKWSKKDDETVQELVKIKGSMNSTLAKVDAFLKVVDDFRRRRRRRNPKKKAGFVDLEEVFKAAAKIPDVNFSNSTLDEIKAVVTKIYSSGADSINSVLEELKDLNLEFSSFGFQHSVTTLTAVDRFFTSYGTQMATVPKVPTPPTSGNATVIQSAPAQVIMVTGAPQCKNCLAVTIVVAFFVIAGSIFLFFLCREDCKNAARLEALEETEKTQMTPEHMLALLTKVAKTIGKMDSDRRSPQYFGEQILESLSHIEGLYKERKYYSENLKLELRDSEYICKEETMPKLLGFANPFINANEMLIGKSLWIMSQAPQDGTEPVNNCFKVKADTREKFWSMINQKCVRGIAQICNFIENNIIKCANYYSLQMNGQMKFGRYLVKTIAIEKDMERFKDKKSFTLYTIQYSMSEAHLDVPKKTVKILHFTGWPDHGSPLNPTPALEIIRYLDSLEANVLIVSSNGVGRAGALVSIRYGIKLVQEKVTEDVIDVIKPVRACRYGAVQTPDQVTYIVLCVTKAIRDSKSIPNSDDYAIMYNYHKQNVLKHSEKNQNLDKDNKKEKNQSKKSQKSAVGKS